MISERPSGAHYAMMREIAVKTGNFRGVCPLNRAAEDLCSRVYRHGETETGRLAVPVFLLSWSDTHEGVDRK